MKKIREVLLVDDNPADLDLTTEILSRIVLPAHIHRVMDGLQAMAFLRRQDPYAASAKIDVVLLDLNLPGKSGLEVLREVKADSALQFTPVVIFSTSKAQKDIHLSYKLGANCYINKPGNLTDFASTITSFANFWFSCARSSESEE